MRKKNLSINVSSLKYGVPVLPAGSLSTRKFLVLTHFLIQNSFLSTVPVCRQGRLKMAKISLEVTHKALIFHVKY